jgi:hypothetical protein
MAVETFAKILFAVVTGVALYLGWRARKTRRRELTELAAECGLKYSEEDPFDLPASLIGIGAFGPDIRSRHPTSSTASGADGPSRRSTTSMRWAAAETGRYTTSARACSRWGWKCPV